MRQQGKPTYQPRQQAPQNGHIQGASPLARVGDDMGSDAGAIVGSGGTLVQARTQYHTAVYVQRARDIEAVRKSAVKEAGLCGEGFFYSWSVNDKNKPGGKGLVEGVSVDGAMILARNFTNCVCPVEVAVDGPQHWILHAAFVDLETGFTVERLFRQRKGERHGRFDEERALDIAFQIGQSKAQRNVILKAMPQWLTESCLDAAKDAAELKYKDVPKQVPKFIRRFEEMGVTLEQLEAKLNRPRAKWEPCDLVTLAAIGRAIADRQTTVEQEFENKSTKEPGKATPSAQETESEAGEAGDEDEGDESGDGDPGEAG